MTQYARVAGGTVMELFTPPAGFTIAQCFHAALTWADLTGINPVPQPGWAAAQNAGVWSFTAPAAPVLTVVEQAEIALMSGCAIVSSGTPALSGTYPIDPTTQGKLASVSTYILINSRFPGNHTSLSIPDTAGAFHVFTSTAEFQAFASAIGDYVTALDQVVAGASTTLPTQPVAIP